MPFKLSYFSFNDLLR